MEKLVLMEAMAEVTAVVREGAAYLHSEKAGRIAEVPFSEMNRDGRVGLLESEIDWNLYFEVGMEPENAERIIENAADGRPQDRWMEPLGRGEERQTDHKSAIMEVVESLRETFGPSQSGLSFNELLESYAVEPAQIALEQGRDR